MVAPIEHGGELAKAIAQYGGTPEEWLDLSTGINPNPYPIPELPIAAYHRLPEAHAVASLEDAARFVYGCGPDLEIVAAPGTQALIQLLPRLQPLSNVSIVSPTYGEHEHCWKLAGHRILRIPQPEPADILVVASPNNPDGRDWSTEYLSSLARLVIIDEAFRDTTPSGDVPPDHATNVIVLRSFGKFFGLAGLRLGFAIGPRNLIEPIRLAIGPWAVSGPACSIATRALHDAEWINRTRNELERSSEDLENTLSAAGCRTVGRTSLFITVERGDAADLAVTLAKRRILVRSFAYAPTWLRFGLPADEAARDRLQHALAHA